MSEYFKTHQETLTAACDALRKRDFWSAYPESPSPRVYGETAKDDGEAAFKDLLGKTFSIEGHPGTGTVGKEVSPYGLALDIKYPSATVDELILASKAAGKAWGKATIEARVGVCLEILHRINRHSFEMANAVMHTTGQAFMMAFQAGGPHAQDRGLEAVAYAFDEMTKTPGSATWTKPQGKHDPIVMEKSFRVIPRGIALTIGCATFPTWNGYPGIFGSLATGNTVIVKPHPMAILPLALTIKIGREVLAEAGFDPNVLLLAADEPGAEKTKDLVTNADINIIDFTGSNAFGKWVRDNAPENTQVYTEEAGVNSIVVSSTDNFKGMCSNIGFSLSLYSGQMCTAPQAIWVPREGIETDQGHKSFEQVAEGIKISVDKLLGDPARAAGICGAIVNPATLERVKQSEGLGEVVRPSTGIEGLEEARTATPMILKVDAAHSEAHLEERFGPISFVVAVDDTQDGIERAANAAKTKGAITAGIYATDESVLDRAADAFADAGVGLSCNLTGSVFVNQNAAFSDYHVSGANPAGNACLTDSAFVANRFRITAVRRHKAA
ncbi:phenylacetic acid degradation protein PaaN [Pseudovibrio exalbescens]|uniref:phenylacetic acid degradation protein PaaN n=1 Tax=Pseudovibrio exalbescens TaxID=197461 RepID=UPI0023652BCF|nr:phenylacetic acid degradation protein PaaN [Pseudovibrio exalbescens]MDD7910743.1 phenylacetic acid degradation protein PaaN [Pseudovibrio exalbescens]